jgi:hypothetical protein
MRKPERPNYKLWAQQAREAKEQREREDREWDARMDKALEDMERMRQDLESRLRRLRIAPCYGWTRQARRSPSASRNVPTATLEGMR